MVDPKIKCFMYTWGEGRITAEGERIPGACTCKCLPPPLFCLLTLHGMLPAVRCEAIELGMSAFSICRNGMW